LIDKDNGKYFFQRIEPIYPGTIIIDIFKNRVITLEKKNQRKDWAEQMKKIKEGGKFSKKIVKNLQNMLNIKS